MISLITFGFGLTGSLEIFGSFYLIILALILIIRAILQLIMYCFMYYIFLNTMEFNPLKVFVVIIMVSSISPIFPFFLLYLFGININGILKFPEKHGKYIISNNDISSNMHNIQFLDWIIYNTCTGHGHASSAGCWKNNMNREMQEEYQRWVKCFVNIKLAVEMGKYMSLDVIKNKDSSTIHHCDRQIYELYHNEDKKKLTEELIVVAKSILFDENTEDTTNHSLSIN